MGKFLYFLYCLSKIQKIEKINMHSQRKTMGINKEYKNKNSNPLTLSTKAK